MRSIFRKLFFAEHLIFQVFDLKTEGQRHESGKIFGVNDEGHRFKKMANPESMKIS